MAELLTALDILRGRISDGRWPALEADVLDDRADEHGIEANMLTPDVPAPPAFFGYESRPFPRQYDIRLTGRMPPDTTATVGR